MLNISDLKQLSQAIRNKSFISLDELDTGFYEIVSKKRSIYMDVPVVIGFVILQYAKLRMLQFYYDFIDKSVHLYYAHSLTGLLFYASDVPFFFVDIWTEEILHISRLTQTGRASSSLNY